MSRSISAEGMPIRQRLGYRPPLPGSSVIEDFNADLESSGVRFARRAHEGA